jgi:hypothetical protein
MQHATGNMQHARTIGARETRRRSHMTAHASEERGKNEGAGEYSMGLEVLAVP